MDEEQEEEAEKAMLERLAAMQPLEHWAGEVLALVDTGDQRRHDRLVEVLLAVAQRPGRSLPEQCEDPAALKAAYRLLGSQSLLADEILKSAAQSSVSRLRRQAQGEILLAVQDTTTLNFSTHAAMEGRGPIGNSGNSSKVTGFHAHTTLLLGEKDVVHGLLECEVYARDQAAQQQRKKGERNRQPAAEKESQRWVRSLHHSAQLCAQLPHLGGVINIADREADMYEWLVEAKRLNLEHEGRFHVLVRAQHDRVLQDTETRLWAHLQEQPAQVCWSLQLPAAKGIHGRQERHVEALWQKVTLAAPAHQKKYQGHEEPVAVEVIIVREPAPPPGAQPLEWVLLTSWPIASVQEAQRVVGWYARRWQIEVMHRVWKSGCKVEQRRFQQMRAAQVMMVLDLLSAVMLMGLVGLSRHDPEANAQEWLSAQQCAVLSRHFERQAKGIGIGKPLTIGQSVRWIAQLGGHRGAPSSPPPGADTLWRGMIRLKDMTLGWIMASTADKCG
jgi:hypothetical protein